MPEEYPVNKPVVYLLSLFAIHTRTEKEISVSCIVPEKKSSLVHLLILCAVALSVYFKVLRNEFVWDDTLFLTNVDAYRTLDFWRLFLTPGNGLEYLPIRDLSYAMDFVLWGENSAGFHFTNLLLYVVNIVAVYFFSKTLVTEIQSTRGDQKREPATVAFWTAAFFALIPIHCEAVNFIGGGRNTLLAALFAVLASRSFVLFLAGEGNFRRVAAAFLFYVLAVLSKATAITLPLFILAICAVIRRRPLMTRLAATTPFLLTSGIVYFAYTSIATKSGLISQPAESLPIADKIAVAAQIPFFYLGKFIIPTNLSPSYGSPFSSNLTSPLVITSMVAVLALALAAVFFRSRAPLFFVAVCWYGVFLIPVLHLVPTPVIVADRHAYLPSLAFCFLLAWSGTGLKTRWTYPVAAAAAALCLLFGFLSFKQSSVWQSNLTLWQHTVQVAPRSAQAMENLGTIYYHRGNYAKAFDMFNGVRQIEPKNPIYDFFEGKYFYEQGNLPRATTSFEHALEKNPDLIDALFCLADICEKMKNRDCAISYYRRVIASNDLERGPYKKLAVERLTVLGAANIP